MYELPKHKPLILEEASSARKGTPRSLVREKILGANGGDAMERP